MDNETALPEFERYLRRRYPERSTAKHYLSDLRQFRKACAKPRTLTPLWIMVSSWGGNPPP